MATREGNTELPNSSILHFKNQFAKWILRTHSQIMAQSFNIWGFLISLNNYQGSPQMIAVLFSNHWLRKYIVIKDTAHHHEFKSIIINNFYLYLQKQPYTSVWDPFIGLLEIYGEETLMEATEVCMSTLNSSWESLLLDQKDFHFFGFAPAKTPSLCYTWICYTQLLWKFE